MFRCRVCRKVISNLNFEKHLLKKHMMDRIQYKDMYGSLEYTRLVYYRSVHKCSTKICKVHRRTLDYSITGQYKNTVQRYVRYTGVH